VFQLLKLAILKNLVKKNCTILSKYLHNSNCILINIIYTFFIHRSSGGAKGDSESEADPFVQPKMINNIKYENYLINLKFQFLIVFTLYREEQFKAPKRKVSSRLRIESHPTDVHKGIDIKLSVF